MSAHRVEPSNDTYFESIVTLGRLGRSLVVLAACGLSACAGLRQVPVDVSAFGGWPGGRAAGTYAIDRLPSQQRVPDTTTPQGPVEVAAAAALEDAGFRRAEDPAQADVLVRVASRRQPVVAPYGMSVGIGIGRGYGAWGMGYGGRFPYGGRGWGPDPFYEQREVDLLLTDRRTHQALYEAHGRVGGYVASESYLKWMFDATLQGFPMLTGERRVVVQMPSAAD